MLAIVSVSMPLLVVSGCSADKFRLGECVIVKNGITNDDMKKAACEKTSIQEQLDGKTVYRVTSVIDYEKSCPRSTDVTFNYESHDATYCLIQY
jgi:hypothetical protein